MRQQRLPHRRLRTPAPRSTRALEDRYTAHLSVWLERLYNHALQWVLPQVPGLIQDADEFEVIAQVFRGLRLSYFEQERSEMAQARAAMQQIAQAVDGQNASHVKEIMRRVLNVNPLLTEPWLEPLRRNWLTENVSLVTSVGTEMLGGLEQSVYRTVRGEQTFKELKVALEQRYQLSRARAQLIARDQVSKLNGQLTKERQTRLGVTGYWWRDSRDVRVRPMHRQLARESDRGKMYSWDAPPVTNKAGDHNHPGGDYQCRCWADPIIPGVDDR